MTKIKKIGFTGPAAYRESREQSWQVTRDLASLRSLLIPSKVTTPHWITDSESVNFWSTVTRDFGIQASSSSSSLLDDKQKGLSNTASVVSNKRYEFTTSNLTALAFKF